LHWTIFCVGTVYGGICLQACDEIVTMVLGLRQHGYVSSVQHVKGAESDTDAFAFIFEAPDVIENHNMPDEAAC
jgi:hypothetical protein